VNSDHLNDPWSSWSEFKADYLAKLAAVQSKLDAALEPSDAQLAAFVHEAEMCANYYVPEATR
jgi:hypothetical protein